MLSFLIFCFSWIYGAVYKSIFQILELFDKIGYFVFIEKLSVFFT